MRKFIVTIEGKQYEVGVEEVGAGASVAPVVTQVSAPAPAAAPAAAPTATQFIPPCISSILVHLYFLKFYTY